MGKLSQQSLLFKGIYEFEDPSGGLLAARIPPSGSAALYNGTALLVRPSQSAILVYKGKVADVFGEGLHQISTENVPILTQLANWKFGLKSPLRCDLWFFAGQVFPARRWGTAKPVMATMDAGGPVPIRAYGNYGVVIRDPRKLLLKLVGTRSTFDITDLEDFIQGKILEAYPKALALVRNVGQLSQKQRDVSTRMEELLSLSMLNYGIRLTEFQIASQLPTKEIMDALDARVAMNLIGDKKEYLLYKAANSLGQIGSDGSADPMQMMLGLMLSKGLMGVDYHQKEKVPVLQNVNCHACQKSRPNQARFCPHCGEAQ